ncbi:MAG: type 4a pilus biogenesis protein PilO [Parcubacteria group bacterium]
MKYTKPIILILIASALFYTVVSPRWAKVQVLQAEVAQYRSVLLSVESLIKARDELKLKYQNIPRNELEALKKVLPDNVNTVELALNLDGIGAKYGISIKSIKIVAEKDANATVIRTPSGLAYEKVVVSFSFISNYQNFKRFMYDLERSLRIIEVRSVTFQVTENELNEYQLQIETYWLK